MIKGWMLRPIIKALFALFDAVKDIDARLKWLERADAMAMSPARRTARHDVVWENIDITAAQLREMRDHRLKPIETDCPNCCAGPLEKVPRADCPRCNGTGKVEIL